MKDYVPNQDLEFFSNSFKLTFICMPNVLTIDFSNMIFKHFHDGFYLNNFASGF
jgi:hypothetical protein